MYWLFGVVIGAVVLVLLVLTVINFKRYAWLVILVFVLLIAAISIFYLYESDIAASKDAFSASDIVLSEAQLTPSHGSYYQFSATIKNLSTVKQLAAIEVLIDLLECTGDGSDRHCEVSESSQKQIKLRLLASDAKRVESYIAFSNIAIERADDQWRYTLIRGIGR